MWPTKDLVESGQTDECSHHRLVEVTVKWLWLSESVGLLRNQLDMHAACLTRLSGESTGRHK